MSGERHFNKLTPAEAERLAILAEECGEVVQIVGKILRHGYESYHPDEPERGPNQGMLERECGDVRAIIGVMEAEGDLDEKRVSICAATKYERMAPYLHHQQGESDG